MSVAAVVRATTPATNTLEKETQALLMIASCIKKRSTRRIHSHPLSKWQDVQIDMTAEGHVQDVCLASVDLSLDLSQLHVALLMLPHIVWLDLSNNDGVRGDIGGHLPSSMVGLNLAGTNCSGDISFFADFEKLEYLNLSTTHVSGDISTLLPIVHCKTPVLKALNVKFCVNLTGSLSSTWEQIPGLVLEFEGTDLHIDREFVAPALHSANVHPHPLSDEISLAVW